MKKKLLILCSLLASTTFSSLKAQDFDYDMTFGKISETQAANDITKKAATNINGVKGGVTQNGILLYDPNVSNNKFVPKTDVTTEGYQHVYIKGPAGNPKYCLYMESQTALRKVAFLFAGPTETSSGSIAIRYGTPPPDTTGMGPDLGPAIMSAWTNSLKEKISDVITSAAPGVPVFFDVNDAVDYNGEAAATTYVLIYIKTGNNAKIYRFAASTTNFTSLPLPLDFLSFTAKANNLGNSVNLNWKTANEVNTKEFIVERGTNTTDFKAIGTLASANTAGEHNYNFVDAAALAGTSYYRIKQVDKDGKFDYSEVQEVSVKGGVSLSVYPNPTSDVLNISHQAAANATLKVLNVQGQAVINQAVASGSVLTNLSISSLASGVYTLILNNAGGQSAVKFVKN